MRVSITATDLASCPKYLTDKLELVLRAAARGPSICHAPRAGAGYEKALQFVTGEEGVKIMRRQCQFFHNSQFNVLFYILSYIKQISVANITFRVVRN